MIKFTLLTLIALIIASGIWFLNRTDPQKLDLADRFWPGTPEYSGHPKTGIAYGEDARQKLDIYMPVAEGKGGKSRHPVLVFFHGGSWTDGEREGYGFLGRTFAARGFVTVIADYRKSPKVKFPAFVDDAAHAIAWTYRDIAQYGGSPDHIYLMGHSAGAHVMMMATLDTQYLAKFDLTPDIIRGVIGLAGPYDFLPFTSDGAKMALGNWPKPDETQPINFARQDAPPMLLLSGDGDTIVKPRNGIKLAAAITGLGGVAHVKTYPGIGHSGIIMAVSRAFRSKAPVVDDVINFTQQY